MKTIVSTAKHRQGLAVVVMLALLSILVLYVAANLRSISDLDRELKLTERHQLQRLNSLSATNAAQLKSGPSTATP